MTVPITETFDDPLGRLQYYDTNDVTLYDYYKSKAHADIRSFFKVDTEVEWQMYELSQKLVGPTELGDFIMSDFDSHNVSLTEAWSSNEFSVTPLPDGADSALGGLPSLRLSMPMYAPAGPNGIDAWSKIETPLDFTQVPDDWQLSITLPNFPGLYVDKNLSYIEFVPNDFDRGTGPPVGSTKIFLTNIQSVNGNQELTFPASAVPDTFDTVHFHFVPSVTSGPTFDNFDDDFSLSLDRSKWDDGGTPTRIFTSGGSLHMTTAANSSEEFSGKERRNMLNSSVAAEITSMPTGIEFWYKLEPQYGTASMHVNAAGNLICTLGFGSATPPTSSGTTNVYNPVAHKWFRIREASGTVYFEVSPDGSAWTVLHSDLSSKVTGTATGPQGPGFTTARFSIYVENNTGTPKSDILINQIVGTGVDPPTSPAAITVAALRFLSPTWSPPPPALGSDDQISLSKLDIDTLHNVLRITINRDGTVPTAALPHVWRATLDDPGGPDDPRPVNVRMGVTFFTGSMAANNKIDLYIRGRREDFLTQLDLDGTDPGVVPSYGENQASLNARMRQPDYGQARYNPRPQSDLENLTQSNLDPKTQAEMERLVDTISASWVKITLNFGLFNQVELSTTETLNDDERYYWPATLTANTSYTFRIDVIDSTVTLKIFEIEPNGAIDVSSPVFDSTGVRNDFLFKRRRGRVGWQIDLHDTDAYVDSVRSRGMMYGEVMTNSFESFTPVVGARIYSGSTPDQTIIPNTSAAFGSEIFADTRVTRSADGSVRVAATPGQGLWTDFHTFEDFNNTEIFFDLYTATGGANNFLPGLLNERGMLIPLVMTRGVDNRWQTFRVYASGASNQMSGKYRFVLMQMNGDFTWWVDNLYFMERSVAYSGRSEALDPWGRGGNNWIDFRSLVNNDNGVLFGTRGNFIQIRAQALKQGINIDKIYVKPQYAQLGRFVWNP